MIDLTVAECHADHEVHRRQGCTDARESLLQLCSSSCSCTHQAAVLHSGNMHILIRRTLGNASSLCMRLAKFEETSRSFATLDVPHQFKIVFALTSQTLCAQFTKAVQETALTTCAHIMDPVSLAQLYAALRSMPLIASITEGG